MRYSTVNNWAEYFEETEGVQIHSATIRRKLHEAGTIGMTGRDKIGRVLRYAYFSESDVRSACADLLQPLPQVDKNGFFEKDGQIYGTNGAWAKTLGISDRAISSRITTHKFQGIKGKSIQSNIRDFFPESIIREICTDLLENIPHADKNGLFETDGQKYGTIEALARTLQLSRRTISSRITTHHLQGVKGKIQTGYICDFYSESAIRETCADLLEDMPQVNEEGFFEKDGQRYGTIQAWSKIIRISRHTISSRLITHNLQGIEGKDRGGRVQNFFPETAIRLICSSLLQPLHQVDKEGFFIKDGEKYGTQGNWRKVLRVSQNAISNRIQTHTPKSIKGKDKNGNICDFYPESVIRQICADILEKRKTLNPACR